MLKAWALEQGSRSVRTGAVDSGLV